MANTTQEIYDGRGARIGWIETDERGNKRVYSMTKGIVGYHYRDADRTVMVGGKIIGYCDCASALLF